MASMGQGVVEMFSSPGIHVNSHRFTTIGLSIEAHPSEDLDRRARTSKAITS
jgi:hypothetical protein